jgi:ubiquinone/menaquinone biosynthesis C-methylase UbiE
MRQAVGPDGHVYGVDLSTAMLAGARDLVRRRGWGNFTLTRRDAVNYFAPQPLDAVLFGFSYATMPHHLKVLQHAVSQLRPGGRVVIMDARPPSGPLKRFFLPFGIWLMQKTLLGNPLLQPWEHLAGVTDNCETKDYLFSSYYVSRGIKPFAAMVEAAE